ncbi:MAG: NAD(P) transhydrogenase subunit alpha [Erythrobacter sp.]|uniref:NAD(P) transhydrogenase subunit alpha n=1 Tax=Erythrobacter sp. TaxID=1042 RepID=UPI0032EBF14B
MKIAVLKERADGETRVAATPETVKKFIGLGNEVALEEGAGATASITDEAFAEAGAILGDAAATVKDADIVLGVQAPEAALLAGAKPGAWVAALFDPFQQGERVEVYAKAGLEALSMEFMPRITRAQSMDVLSSQSNLAGYKAVLAAADEYGRAFPMMMTAAGTVQAARCFVMGVGVAGLQAIATAKRLGAQVSATDVRPETAEQITSLGAKAVFAEGLEAAGEGGYAAELTDEQKAKQAELVSEHIAKQDLVITTALIPGRKAPVLVTDAQIATMKPGSVIFDLAVAQGGNVEGSKPDEVVVKHGVKVMGFSNTPAHLAADASALFARNHFNFLSAFWDKEAGKPQLDEEIGDAIRLTKGGEVVNARLKG